MKICLFTIHNYLACHYALFGYRETLERMGHEVVECSFPSNQVQVTQEVMAMAPSLDTLMECDVILSTYHEYVQPWLERVYSSLEWEALMQKVPVLARFDESMDRGDLMLPHRVPVLKAWATHLSFPAAQDAKKYGGEWLPYGADATIFKPEPATEKKYELAFIGTVYPKRHEYLMKLLPHIGKNVTFYIGNVMVQDLAGMAERETTERLAKNYRQIKIFFCLPPASRLIVEKVFDVMACDTMVMYPRFPDARENMSVFQDERHIVYYDLGFFANNGKLVKYYLEHPDDVARIARAGGERVREKYTLEGMLQAMLNQAVPF